MCLYFKRRNFRKLGPGPRFAGRGIPGLNVSGLSRGQKNPGLGPGD